jgi:hypothetical protein
MGYKLADLNRVVEFRNRLVAFENYVAAERSSNAPQTPESKNHLAAEQSGLQQDYGSVWGLISRYGPAQMSQYGGIVSQDVVRDAIGRLDHPGYTALAAMAVSHLDWIVGVIRADVEGRGPRRTQDDLYRVTSPIYWIGQLGAFLRWLIGTNRGRIVAAISALVLAIVTGLASGAGKAIVDQLSGGSQTP